VGIRVNSIAPGLISTNIIPVDMENRPKVRRDNMPDDPNNPMAKDFIFPRRQGKATEFSSLVLEVIRNTLINGAVLSLDGAIRFSPKW
jgi:NAD(P)-dependent dehydrogenase (short-subunit alcohol dehydrogenase family)